MNVIPAFVRWLHHAMITSQGIPQSLVHPETGDWKIYEAQGSRFPAMVPGFSVAWPDNPTYPLVRFQIMAAPSTKGNFVHKGPTRPLVLIEAIVQGEDLTALDGIAQWIEGLFGERSACDHFENIIVQGSHSTDDVPGTDNALDATYKRLGGFYKFFVNAAPA